MGGILETTLNLTQLLDTIRKTAGSIGGLDLSVKGILADQAKLGSEFQNLSNKTGAFSADISVLTDRILQLSKNTNYSIESMTSMQQTLITGFSRPIDDVGTFNALLSKSESLYGKNEVAAKQFIEALGKLNTSNRALRGDMLELMILQGRQAEGVNKLSDNEQRRAGLLKASNQASLDFQMLTGEITAEQYSTTMKMMEQSSAAEKRHQTAAAAIQNNKAANIALMTSGMQALETKLGSMAASVLNNTGSAAVAKASDYISGAINFAKQSGNSADFTKGDLNEKAVSVAKEEASAYDTSAGAELAIKAKFERDGMDKAAIESLMKTAGIQAILIEKAAQAVATQREYAATGKVITEEQKKQNKEIVEQGQSMSVIKGNMKIYSEAIVMSNSALEKHNQMLAYSGVSSIARNTEATKSIGTQQQALDLEISQGERGLEIMIAKNAALQDDRNPANQEKLKQDRISSLDKDKKDLMDENAKDSTPEKTREENKKKIKDIEDTKEKVTSAKPEEAYSILKDNSLSNIEKAKAALSQTKSERESIAYTQGMANLKANLAGEETMLEIKRSQNAVTLSEISLMDSLAVGIGANAAAREKAAMELMGQAKIKDQQIEKTKAAISESTTAAERGGYEKKLNELVAERNGLNKQALDQLQKLREGYLDAIDSMQSGAGIFTEMIVSQDQSLGALIRTTGEVPRVLKTGAGSGGLTQATQFGVGGMTGGFNPQSEEYGKSVLSSFDDMKKLVEQLPGQIAQNSGGNAALGAKTQGGDNELLGGVAPGTVGVSGTPASAQVKIKDQEIEKTKKAISESSDPATKGEMEKKLNDLTIQRNALNKQASEQDKKTKELNEQRNLPPGAPATAPSPEKIKDQLLAIEEAKKSNELQVKNINQDIKKNYAVAGDSSDPAVYGAAMKKISELEVEKAALNKNTSEQEKKTKELNEQRNLPPGAPVTAPAPAAAGAAAAAGTVVQNNKAANIALDARTVEIANLKEMTDKISAVIQRGVVDAVTTGMANAIKELSRS